MGPGFQQDVKASLPLVIHRQEHSETGGELASKGDDTARGLRASLAIRVQVAGS